MSTIITTNIPAKSFDTLRTGWGRFKAGFIKSCQRYARVQSRRDLIEALEAKSDDELAQLGLARENIALQVFRDKFYI